MINDKVENIPVNLAFLFYSALAPRQTIIVVQSLAVINLSLPKNIKFVSRTVQKLWPRLKFSDK